MTNDELETLAAKQAITEVIYRYCRGLDRMDRTLALSVWHPGGTADYGEEMYVGTGEGFVDWVWQQHAHFDRHSHQITNILIDVDDPPTAAAHFNWLIMSAPINRAMLLGDDGPPSASDLDTWADGGVGAFLAAYGRKARRTDGSKTRAKGGAT